MQSQIRNTPSGPGSLNNLSQSMKKSIGKVKQMTQQDFYLKRYNKIREILSHYGVDVNLVLPEEDLLNLLDSLGKATFDREIAAQLLERMPISQNPNYPSKKFYGLQDFIDTHIKAEYLLLLQLDETENELNSIYPQITQLKNQVQIIAKDPIATEGSNSLQVDIDGVTSDDPNFRPEKGSVYSVIVVFDRYKYETDEVRTDGKGFNLAFNRTFHLKATSPQETIKILLRDFKRYSSGDPTYTDLKCTLTLEKFEDQEIHSEWFYLYDQYNNLTKFKVHATIHWQLNNLSTQEEMLNTLVALEEKLNENKESIDISLKALVYPFAKANAFLKKELAKSGAPKSSAMQQPYYSNVFDA